MAAPLASILLVAAVGVPATLAGCGGDEGESAGRAATVEAAEGVEVLAGEYFFDPATIVAEGGSGRLEITLQNDGKLAHNLRVFAGDEEIGGTPTFVGGESRTGTVEVEPGAYRFVCTVADHEELGMVGELEVR